MTLEDIAIEILIGFLAMEILLQLHQMDLWKLLKE